MRTDRRMPGLALWTALTGAGQEAGYVFLWVISRSGRPGSPWQITPTDAWSVRTPGVRNDSGRDLMPQVIVRYSGLAGCLGEGELFLVVILEALLQFGRTPSDGCGLIGGTELLQAIGILTPFVD